MRRSRDNDLDRFHEVDRTGIFDHEQLEQIAEGVWGADPD